MKHITIIDGHPHAAEGHLDHAFAERYAAEAVEMGSDVRRITVARLEFPLLRNPDDFVHGQPAPDIQSAQRDIAWADHLVMIYPLWIGDIPALLKAFLEQTFRPGFALGAGEGKGFPKQLLRGKSARLIVTMGMPAPVFRFVFGAHSLLNVKKSIFGLCGIKPVSDTVIGGTFDVSEARVAKWLARIANAARCDSKGAASVPAVRFAANAAGVAAASYLAYVIATWAHYGKHAAAVASGGTLLDEAMPDYEVSVHHRIAVRAPAPVTFDVIRNTEFQHSPLVRALLRLREALLGANHVDVRLPHGLVEQMTALGWTIIAETPRELVLGTVTQPWKPNPVFRAVPAAQFTRFSEPGFAKIALTLRVDDVLPDRCDVQTETRVATTDRVSREKFRRYWALLSPGIAMIRLVLLQQIKREAERRDEPVMVS